MNNQGPPRIFFRDQPVKCPVCGRVKKRASWKQIYCNRVCRKKAENERAAARKHEKVADLTKAATTTTAASNNFDYPVDLVGRSGFRWPRTRRLDDGLREKILEIELGVPTPKRSAKSNSGHDLGGAVVAERDTVTTKKAEAEEANTSRPKV